MTSLATMVMSAALFSRRSRTGWLDELDEIRDDALISPDGEVDVLMEPVQRLADIGIEDATDWREAPEPRDLTPAPHRENPAEMWHPEVVVPSGDDGAPLPEVEEEVVAPEDLLTPSGRPSAFRFASFATPPGTETDHLLREPVGRRMPADEPARRARPLGGLRAPTSMDELVPAVAPAARPIPVDDDGTVVVRAGVVRLGPGVHADVRHDSGRIRVDLPGSWCWVTLGSDAEPVTVSVPSGTVALDPGTTALVTVEDDASTFVAVAAGHGVLVEPHGSTPLPAGSVALAPIGGPAQVDQASPAEIEADPLVAHNRDLDTQL